MPPGRAVRRGITNENDENGGTVRLTRAKAAALSIEETVAAQKALQSKKAGSSANAQPSLRRRAALGDVSNVTKIDIAEGRKGLTGKVGLVSKAAQPTGVQKNLSRTNTTRSVLGAKDSNKSTTKVELKRTASGSGVLGGLHKKRQATSNTNSASVKERPEDSEPAPKKLHTIELDRNIKLEESVYKKDIKLEEPVYKKDIKLEESVYEKDIKLEEPVCEREAPPAANQVTATAQTPEEEDIKPRIPDLDAEDVDDPLMVSEYVHEIFEYMRKLELATLPNADYMSHQHDLEWRMRGILVDWLIEVHNRFHLLPETLFLAVNIIDRFLSQRTVRLDRLQLVGVTGMFIASKYEEVLAPHVGSFRHMADDGFTDEEILGAERWVLGTLNYDLSYPNPMNFLRRISKADNYDIHTRTLSKYLMEISLLDHRFMKYVPSHIAAASMYLSRLVLERGEWDATLAHYAGYTEKEIEPVFKLMVDYLARPVTHEAFFKKYASKKFMKASIITRKWAKDHAGVLGINVTEPLESGSSG